MVGHRVVARLAARHSADAPACEKMRPHQIGANEMGAVLAYHAAEQELTGVGGADLARLLVAVERQRVGAEVVTPERFFKALGEKLRFGLELFRPVEFSESRRTTRRQPLAGKHIALHFGERNVALGQTAVSVKDRVIGILPVLIREALLRGAPIL